MDASTTSTKTVPNTPKADLTYVGKIVMQFRVPKGLPLGHQIRRLPAETADEQALRMSLWIGKPATPKAKNVSAEFMPACLKENGFALSDAFCQARMLWQGRRREPCDIVQFEFVRQDRNPGKRFKGNAGGVLKVFSALCTGEVYSMTSHDNGPAVAEEAMNDVHSINFREPRPPQKGTDIKFLEIEKGALIVR